MGVRQHFLAGVARQLSRPAGFRGRLVARGLNRGNRAAVEAAAEATRVAPGQVAADIGFGGGVGLPILLDRTQPGGQVPGDHGHGGHVHGVELSEAMLQRARKQHRDQVAAGSLSLHFGSLSALPLGDGSMDGVITVNTFYFVAELDQAVSELARVARPGGRAVVGVGDPDAMAKMPFTAYGFRLRPVDEVTSALLRAGFASVDHQRLGEGTEAYHLLVATMDEPS
jgi:SAM-dependent methyltransferase